MSPGAPVGFVCLGASAGGLRSLQAVLERLPADLPCPVLVCQHTTPDRPSHLAEILARSTKLPVREAEDGDVPVAGNVYTAPSSSEMGIDADGRIALRAPASEHTPRIDHLFASASFARPARVVAVVLSGTGVDGAAGSLVVKLNGGTVITESDTTAEYSGMPTAAQRAGAVDAIVAADGIGALVDRLTRTVEETSLATERSLRDIASLLARETGTDFVNYRGGTLRRRVEKRRALRGAVDLQAYRALLDTDPVERGALARSLLIPVTEFFRDAGAWDALARIVVPALASRARRGRTVRVWCAGCATGEEAYSIAILLAESIPDVARIHVLGTDLDAAALATAAAGAYDATRLRGVDALRRDRFFDMKKDGVFEVREDLRRLVEFRKHDITHDPPPSGSFDLIVCRNLLIYFEAPLQERTMRMFRSVLAPGGSLFLGRSEAIPNHQDLFAPISRTMRIFRGAGDDHFTDTPTERHTHDDQSPMDRADARTAELPIVTHHDASFVLGVDDAWRVIMMNLHAQERLGRDVVGQPLLDVFPTWQGSPVVDALRACLATGRTLAVRGARAPWGDIDLTLEPVPSPGRGAILIAVPASAKPSTAGRSRAAYGDAYDEDLATTNDELQAANEELAATNEELQAANEELASLNEEFQSTNQHLAASNAELEDVARHDAPRADLLAAIVRGRDEPIVACDRTMRITLYSHAAATLFGLTDASLGRPLHLAGVGVTEADERVWSASPEGPGRIVRQRVADHERAVTRLRSGTGETLGWVVVWTKRPPPTP